MTASYLSRSRWRTVLVSLLLCPLLLLLPKPAGAEPSAEQILRAADEARGSVSGLAWQVKIESAENERTTDSLVYDIKVRSFNVAGLSMAPPKYRGNKILMLNNNMWFYKPGLSRPVPISQRQKLMGDAAYGDIAATNYAEHYQATRLPDDSVDGEDCYVFDLKAKNEKVTYDRIVYWVSKQRQLGVKAEYFTVSGKKFKSASMDYANTVKLGGKSRPFLSRITLHGELLNGAVTYLQLDNPRIEPIPDYVFDLNLFMR
jgi:outer membrane lipoprotein-sorting protein